jgi:hypothetical protein
MKTAHALLLGAFLASPLAVSADPWKDGSGHGKRHHREYKEEYWDGPCKVKRQYKNGKYKEKRECERPRHSHYRDRSAYDYDVPAIVIEPVIRIGIGRD